MAGKAQLQKPNGVGPFEYLESKQGVTNIYAQLSVDFVLFI